MPVSDDQIVEEGEMILLSLSPINMPLMVDPGSVTTAVVMVIDDDGEYVHVYIIMCVFVCAVICTYLYLCVCTGKALHV